MTDEKVIAYVRKELEKGYKPDLIREVLTGKGYDSEEAREAVESQIHAINSSASKSRESYNGEGTDSIRAFISHASSATIKKPGSRVLAFLIIPGLAFLLAGAVMSYTKRLENASHMFRSLFIIGSEAFVMTGITKKIGERLNFHNTGYNALFKLLLSAGLVFVFIEYFFSPAITLLAIIPAFLVLTLLLRTRFVNDTTGACIASFLIIMISTIITYVLVAGMAILLKAA